jgi:type II secretory pathway pseudopilin PulG
MPLFKSICKFNKRLKATSMIEIAIVITIVGIMATALIGGTSYIKSQRVNSLASRIMALKSTMRLFYSVNSFLPGDAFGTYIGDMNGYGNTPITQCGNGDGVISWNSRSLTLVCQDASCVSMPTCTGPSSNVSGGSLVFSNTYNESMLFARHLWLFGGLGNFGFSPVYDSNSLNKDNTVPTGYKDTVFLPFFVSSNNTSGIENSFGFKNTSQTGTTHTIMITGISKQANNATYKAFDSLTNIAASSFDFPSDFTLPYQIANGIDSKIDDGVRNTGEIKHCSSLTTCQVSDKLDVIIGIKFDL